MRTIIQRVTKASVTVGDELISSIGRGLCILVGISKDDTPKEREYLVRKILNLRLFDDENDKRWAKSVKDKQLEILCVSQFTLYSILKGNKPDFHQAMPGDQSQIYYNEFLDMLRKDYHPDKIKDGKFGAHMQVNIQNDGPVTIQIDSPPDPSSGTAVESAGNTDLLGHSRQAPANLKRKHEEIQDSSSDSYRPLQSIHGRELALHNSDGYLACSVCSNGLTHVDERHLTTTACSRCGRGLHQHCSVLHRCDLNSDVHVHGEQIHDKREEAQTDGIMIHTPARVCIECEQGGLMSMCAGCDHNLHEECRSHHDCPALAQYKHPTLSQVLHKKYSKYGGSHRDKPPEAQQPKKSFRLERYKTKKDCCVCSNRGTGVHIRRRSSTVCYYCKKGLHWDCRFKHNCELMAEPVPSLDGDSNVIFLTGGNRKRRDCIVCSQRKLGQRHRSRTICKFCKKGLHRKCEHKHLCPWFKNSEGVPENEEQESFIGNQNKKQKMDPIAHGMLPDNSGMLPDNSSIQLHLPTHNISMSNSIMTMSNSSMTISNSNLNHQPNSHTQLNAQEELLSQLNLRQHQTQALTHHDILAQPSTTRVKIENDDFELDTNAHIDNQADLEATQGHSPMNRDIDNNAKPTIVKIVDDNIRDGRKDCIVCSSRTCFGRRKRSYTQCSLCKKGLHHRCLQFHICGLSKQHPKFDVPAVSSTVNKTTLFNWIDKASERGDEAHDMRDNLSQGDRIPMLVKVQTQTLVDCKECAYHDGFKKMTHLMCSVCSIGVHKKCFYRHQCHRDQGNTSNNMSTGTFVGERPSVIRIESDDVKDGRKACDVCSGKMKDGKRQRSRTQCAVCRRGLHIRCLAQHICPGSEFANSYDSQFATALSEQTMPVTSPINDEVNDVMEHSSPLAIKQHHPMPSTSNYMTITHSPVPIKGHKERDSRLVKTGLDNPCTVCPSAQKTRMACRDCQKNVHYRCEGQHYCKQVSKQNSLGVTGGRFTGDVVPILVSDVKTRKKDCAVCSNRKEGRRSRSSTMCPHCKRGLHRICAQQHICPLIKPSQDFNEMDTSGNPDPFEDIDDDMGYVEINDGITRYCCVCSTSRKSQITRTACSSCDRGLHPQCVLLHNCHSMVPRRLQISPYQKQARYEDDVTEDVEIVRSSTKNSFVDPQEASNHHADGAHEIIDDKYDSVVEVHMSDDDLKQKSDGSQKLEGFDTGVTSVKVLDERRDPSDEYKKYLLISTESEDGMSRDEEESSTEYHDEGDMLVPQEEMEVRREGIKIKEEINGLKSPFVEAEDVHEQHDDLTNNSESLQGGCDVPLTQSDTQDTCFRNHGEESAEVDSKRHAGDSSGKVLHPTPTHTELISECSNSPDGMDVGCLSNMQDTRPDDQIRNEGTTQDLEQIVAQIREELGQVGEVGGQMINLCEIEGDVLAIQPEGV